jgi:hypothetical protein
MQLTAQYYQQVLGLGQTMVQAAQMPGANPEAIVKMVDQAATIFKRTLDDFEVPDAEQFVIRGKELFDTSKGNVDPTGPVAGVQGAAAGVPQVAGI